MKIELTTEQKEIVIRKGNALEPKPEKSITINGTLRAPHQFVSRKDLDPLSCHLQIMYDKGEIVLYANDTDAYVTHIIKGSLTTDSILKQFAINSEKRWNVQEFLKFIKAMRYYFASREAHQKLVESLQTWSVKVERVINEHNDNKGNSNFQLETKVRGVELVSAFDLNIPIFQGYEKFKFTVEIGLDPKNTAVQIYLISDDLIELEVSARERLLNSHLADFDSFDCAKITVS